MNDGVGIGVYDAEDTNENSTFGFETVHNFAMPTNLFEYEPLAEVFKAKNTESVHLCSDLIFEMTLLPK